MKRILSLILTLGLIASFLSCSSDEEDFSVVGGIYGTVTDSKTGQPISNANITITPINISTTTGADGGFVFSDIEAGNYKITVNKPGYLYNNRQVTVIAGQDVLGDIIIKEEGAIIGFELNPSQLYFGSTYSSMIFKITNSSNHSANSWNITSTDENWYSVSPKSGTLAVGESQDVKVTLDRSKITTLVDSYFIVNAGGGSKSVNVSALSASDGEGNSSENSAALSDVSVTSPFNDITVKPTNVYTKGNELYLDFKCTYTGGQVADRFVINPDYSSANDDDGNVYPNGLSDFYLALGSDDYSTWISSNVDNIHPNTVFKGGVKITNIHIAATKITTISIDAILNGTKGSVIFSNIPIIR